ncbi:hypothetical protein C8Q76DRAFT_796059 [Earliella scabrosa]|nr:hypothetical protein C8Q76DRAFT_796059 [Earliella scabrosa]
MHTLPPNSSPSPSPPPSPPTRLASSHTDTVAAHALQEDDETMAIFARWTNYVGGDPMGPEDFKRKAHVYDVRIPPAKPLRHGERVRLYALSPARFHTPECEEEVYDAYDVHVVGRIGSVVGAEDRRVMLEVANECGASGTRKIWLSVPYAPGFTVEIGEAEELKVEEARKGDFDAHIRVGRTAAAAAGPCRAWECAMQEDPVLGYGAWYVFRGRRRR